jgi:hypothetical protein
MPKGWFTSASGLKIGACLPEIAHLIFIPQLFSALLRLNHAWTCSLTRCFVTPSWTQFLDEFYCRGCGGHEVYRSRPRNFFEKYVLPVLLLRAVRCERCYHRRYVLRTIPVLERVQSERKPSEKPAPDRWTPGGRVA